jgi:shikimate kinase/3-dehydroquinate synthase
MYGIEMNIVLAGFMGTGKSVVGSEISRISGRRMVDADEEIERRAGISIPEIFERFGEPYFRNLEAEVIRDLCRSRNLVISVGGGAMVNRQNLKEMRMGGIVFCLNASPEEIKRRVGDGEGRPMLSGYPDKLARIKELLEIRRPYYEKADFQIWTEGRDPDEIAREIIGLASVEVVTVNLGPRSYRIYIGPCILRASGRLLLDMGIKRAFVVTNDVLASLWLGDLMDSMEDAGIDCGEFVVPDGEIHKSLSDADLLYSGLAEFGADRKTALIAFGGGVVGDLAGFVAATYMRGIPLIQIPTTLLSQVDSSIGGKVAVNHSKAKNLIGTFYQPKAVISDTKLLSTLSEREILGGLAEVIKYGVIRDPELLSMLEAGLDVGIFRNQQDPTSHRMLKEIVRRCCEIKAWVVERDEMEEGGLRMILNFGHTIGHGIEAAAGFGGISHGEAVAIGMVAEAEIAMRMGICAKEDWERIRGIVEKAGLPIRVTGCDDGFVRRALDHISLDKKAIGGRLRFSLPSRIGEARIEEGIPWEVVEEVLSGICIPGGR